MQTPKQVNKKIVKQMQRYINESFCQLLNLRVKKNLLRAKRIVLKRKSTFGHYERVTTCSDKDCQAQIDKIVAAVAENAILPSEQQENSDLRSDLKLETIYCRKSLYIIALILTKFILQPISSVYAI